MPNILGELQKRKVFNSAAIYLATAFVLLQAAQIIIPALKIPDWTISFLVVLAILGFPIVIIISWLYDISDKGFVKTTPAQSTTDDDTPIVGMSKYSLMGIITFIVISIFMTYQGLDLLTSSKEVSDKISIAVLNFDNIRKFPEYDWLGERIAGNLSYRLGEISTVTVIDRLKILNKLGEIDPKKASIIDYKINQIAKNIDVDLILHGSFTIMDTIIEVTALFNETNTGKQISLMLEQYPLAELSDIPTHINKILSAYIKSEKRFKTDLK